MTPDRAERPPLDRARLAQADPDLVPPLAIEVVETATSTNALVVERARAGAQEGLVIVAEHQSAGRGRLDRSWETPPRAAVVFSLLLRPTAPSRSWPWLPLLTGYAVAKALRAEGFPAGVKWPNDVLIGDRKVAGILVERIETELGPAAVVGVGLNVHATAEELPVPTATSLAIESAPESALESAPESARESARESAPKGTPDRTHVLLTVLGTLHETYDAWQSRDLDGARLLESYGAACVTLGQDVRVDLPAGQALSGRAVEIDPGGRLVVENPAGRTAVGAGDVVHVRRLVR